MNQTKNFSGLVSLMLAVLIGALPFAAPEACAQALREGLTLCSGPLLLSLYPFLVVSALLIQCPLGDVLALPFRPVAWLVGVYAPCAARVLLVGFLGGFAPAANASAEAVRSGQMTPEEADRLLPALRLFRTVLCHPDGGTDPAGQHRGGRFAVSGTDHGQLPLCGSAFPTEQGKPKRKKAIAAPETAGNAAAAPGWHSGAVHADLPETLRLCALLPDAGCRSGSAASACREHGLRRCFWKSVPGAILLPARAIGPAPSAVRH